MSITRFTTTRTERGLRSTVVIPGCLSLIIALLLVVVVGCTSTTNKTDRTASDSTLMVPKQGIATDNTIKQSGSTSAPKTIKVNEATLVLAFEQPIPEKLCNMFVPEELIATLYATQIKPDETGTLIIEDIDVGELNPATKTYMAVVKTVKEGGDKGDCILDIFAFRDTNSAHPVIAHAQYEPEYPDVEVRGVQGRKYQISDTEFALAFEWTHEQHDAQSWRNSTMLCLFRVNGDAMEPLFELCTANKSGSDLVESGGYETGSEDRATLETMKSWGKDLYSILVTRTQTHHSTAESGDRTETHKTKTLYQWDSVRYVQTNQLL
jgi:hypothetical protein